MLPCGGGKTECFFFICQEFLKDNPNAKICILLNRVLLLDQTFKRIAKIFDSQKVGVVCASLGRKEEGAQITIATVQSVKDHTYDLVIIDECQRITFQTTSLYQRFLQRQKLILGVSATPWRSSDGFLYGKNKMFDSLTYKKDLKEMIEEGWLVKPVVKTSHEAYDVKNVTVKMGDYDIKELLNVVERNEKVVKQVKEVLERAKDRKAIAWICSSIKHAKMVQNELTQYFETSVLITSEEKNNIQNIKDFSEGKVRHAVSVQMLIEGLDSPIIDCLVMLRPTRSSVVWVQAAGRGLRLSNGKKDCLILDYGRVIENCGSLDQPIVRQGGGRGAKIIQDSAPMKFCPMCLTYVPSAVASCPECNHVFEKTSDNLTTKASTLSPLSVDLSDEWVSVSNRIGIKLHIGPKAKCLRLEFRPKGLGSKPFYDYVFDWDIIKKFRRIGIESVNTFQDAMKYVNSYYESKVSDVLVSYKDKYPKILEVKNAR
jgi:DNA repair protein RadD